MGSGLPVFLLITCLQVLVIAAVTDSNDCKFIYGFLSRINPRECFILFCYLVWKCQLTSNFMFKPWQLLCRSDAVSTLNSLKSNWKNTPPNWTGYDPCGGGWEGIGCTGPRITSMYVTQC